MASASAQFASVVLTDQDLANLQNYSAAPKIYVDNRINDLLNNAPAALDTLNEIAQALGTPDSSALEINVAKPPVVDSKLSYLYNDLMDAKTFDLTNTYGRYTADGINFRDNATITSVANGFNFSSDMSNTLNDSVLDHVKALYLTQSATAVPANGQIAVGSRMKVTVDHKNLPSQFSAHVNMSKLDEDYRLAAGALISGDFGGSWMVLDTFRTNTMVYALYERLPFGWDFAKPANENYAAFTYVIPIHRHAAGEVVNAHFVYDNAEDRVSWYVNGVKKLTISKMGKRLSASSVSDMTSVQATSLGLNLATIHLDTHVNDVGGNDPAVNVKINSLAFGPGVFTLVDMLPTPNLYTAGQLAGTDPVKGLAKCYAFPAQTVPSDFFMMSPTLNDLKTACNTELEVQHIYAFKLSNSNLGATLIKRVDKEIEDRISAVNSEASARLSADQTLQSNIDSESSARVAAVAAEASARAAADAALDSAKYDKTGGVISGLVTAQEGLKVDLGNTSAKLRIGDYWRINASNDGKRLIFEYSANGSNWVTAVPFIQP